MIVLNGGRSVAARPDCVYWRAGIFGPGGAAGKLFARAAAMRVDPMVALQHE
jgi:hypothetical protein